MSRLSDLLNELNEDETPLRELEEIAKRKGHSISYTSIRNYLKGDHPDTPPRKALMALASIFDVEVEILEAAVNYTGHDPYAPPRDADLLTPQQRRAVDEVIRQFAAANERAGEHGGNAAPMIPRRNDYDLAARHESNPYGGKAIDRAYDELGEESQE